MMKKLFLIIISVAVIFGAEAQNNDTLVRNIQIERDYVPDVAPVVRPDVQLTVNEPTIEKSSANFSQFSAPFEIEKGEFIPIAPQSLTSINREKAKSGFLRIGAGVLFNWLADLWYPIWDTKEGYFDIAVHHDGIFGVVKPTKKLFNTDLAINFKKNFGTNQFYLGAKYDNEAFNYYGNDTTFSNHYTQIGQHLDSIIKIQSFNRADFTLGMRSNKRTNSGWLYDAYLNYHLHNISGGFGNQKMSEHNINAAFRADILINEKHHFDVEFGEQTYFYSPTPRLLNWKPNTIIRLLPAYLLNSKKVHLRLGVKTFFNFNKGAVFAVAPDVKIDYFFKEFLNLYAGVTGDYHINSLQNITEENRYYSISNSTKHNTYTPIDIFGGFKVKIAKGLLLDAFVNYKYVNNQIFFINPCEWRDTGLSFDIMFNKLFDITDNTGTLFNAGVRINYNIKERINIFAQMKYGSWNLKKSVIDKWYNREELDEKIAWHTPAFEINAGSEFKIGKKFFGNVNFYFKSKPKALLDITYLRQNAEDQPTQFLNIKSLPATFDLNLGFGYNIKKNISLFAQANNVLALSPKLNYQNWYGYNSFGAHLLIGATILF